MHKKRTVVMLIAAALLSGASGIALAQQSPAKPAPGEGRSMDHGMMGGRGGMMEGGGDMMGMTNMMHGCEQMMGGSSGGSAMMPKMPPGNEKLEFQMRAEMMQKMGEIAAKYASQIKEDRRGTH